MSKSKLDLTKKSYAELNEILERLLDEINSNDQQLEDILEAHQQAERVIAEMQKRLDQAKNKIIKN